jgi:hypothetical protein
MTADHTNDRLVESNKMQTRQRVNSIGARPISAFREICGCMSSEL